MTTLSIMLHSAFTTAPPPSPPRQQKQLPAFQLVPG
jgi:hypothetical protein